MNSKSIIPKCEYPRCDNNAHLKQDGTYARYCCVKCNSYHLREKKELKSLIINKCKFTDCNNLCEFGKSGRLRDYCSDKCQIQDRLDNSKKSKREKEIPPTCECYGCTKPVLMGKNGWNKYCSSSCAGRNMAGKPVRPIDPPKCQNEGCNNDATLSQSADNVSGYNYNKYCSVDCKNAAHSKRLTKYVYPDEAPKCKYVECDNLVGKRVIGGWKTYCCRACRNKDVALVNSEVYNIPAPKCMHPECNNLVTEGKYGHWHKYCSQKCAGQDNSAQSRDKAVETSKKNWGVDNPMHDSEIAEKASKNAHQLKSYILPSGTEIWIQGYESFALDMLFEDFVENDVTLGKTNMPELWYIECDNTKHRYYPDIYIPKENLIIEVKSIWTFDKKGKCEATKNTNILKRECCLNAGYKFIFLVFEENGNLLENYDGLSDEAVIENLQ